MKKNFCVICSRQVTRNEAGLTRKLIDYKAKKYYCMSCLAEYLEVTEEELKAKIEEFKQEGCKLFS